MTRRIRAHYNETIITVYQAYSSNIANPAVRAGKFVSPFKLERMTWIKPSFLWMMYRSGWASKPGQERVLAIEISRTGFEWALEHSCLSSFDASYHKDHDSWHAQLTNSPVRLQWDPERDLNFRPLPTRSIQIGLAAEAVRRYNNDWIVQLSDITEKAHDIHSLSTQGRISEALSALPEEREYPLTERLSNRINAG
jgi:hypothetical protein